MLKTLLRGSTLKNVMIDLSIILNSYHTGPVLFRSIEAILKQSSVHYELIIVNNGNPPPIEERLQQLCDQHDHMHLLTGHGNIGFAKGCNLGAHQAKGDYLLLLNPDCILPPHALCEMVTLFKNDPQSWMAGAKHLLPDGSAQPSNRRNLLSPATFFGTALPLSSIAPRYFSALNLPEAEDETPHHVPAISGALMLFKTTRYHQLGGLDEGYFFHVEDLDLCKRIHDQGGKILYLPSITPLHFLSTSRISSSFAEYHKRKGFTRYLYTHYRRYPIRYILCILAVFGRYYVKKPILALKRTKERASLHRLHRREHHISDYLHATHSPTTQDSPLNTTRIAVIGTSGQVGLSLIKHALHDGHIVDGFYHRTVIDYQHDRLHWQCLQQRPVLDPATHTLIYCAPIWTLPALLPYINTQSVQHIIAFSSSSIDGKARSTNKEEQHTVKQLKDAETQLIEFCQKHDITYTILRPTMIYGIGLDANISTIQSVIRKIGLFPVIWNATGKRAPVHVEDLANAALCCISHQATHNQIYTLSGGESLSYRTMVNRAGATVSRPNAALPIPFLGLLFTIARIVIRKKELNSSTARRMREDLDFPHDKASKDFGYTPRRFTP